MGQMKFIYVWMIIILWGVGLLMMACGPRYELKYTPSPDMYAVFTKDKEGCEWYADRNSGMVGLLEGRKGTTWQMKFSDCMSQKGWHKTRVYDKNFIGGK